MMEVSPSPAVLHFRNQNTGSTLDRKLGGPEGLLWIAETRKSFLYKKLYPSYPVFRQSFYVEKII
jgi:hypothetical protein